MKKIILLTIILVVTVMINFKLPAQPNENVKDGIKLTIQAKNSECKRSERFMITLKVENVSSEIIKLYFSRCSVEHLHLIVYDESDKQIITNAAVHRRACRPSDAELLIIKPGDTHTWEEDASSLLWSSWVSPGNLKIKYKYSVPEYWRKDGYIKEGFWEGYVFSNAISLIKYSIDMNSKDNSVIWLKVR